MRKKISLSDDVYARLSRHRRPGERFSQSIDRLLENQVKIVLEFPARVPKVGGSTKQWIEEIETDREGTRVAA